MEPALVDIQELEVSYLQQGKRVSVVKDVSFTIGQGEIVGLVGESGCGKSVTSRAIIGMIKRPGRIENGTIRFDGKELTSLCSKEYQKVRGKEIAMIFQEPMTSLNPVYTIGEQLMETILTHLKMTKAQAKEHALDMLKKAEEKGVKILLPVDCVVAKAFPDPIDGEIEVTAVDADKIPADEMGLDIGPKTAELFANEVKSAKTVVWNGPMGVFENPTLAKGTIAVAKSLAETDAITIIGGGDSAAAVNTLGFGDKMTHISTGGGASLEFLEGKELPGIVCVNDK